MKHICIFLIMTNTYKLRITYIVKLVFLYDMKQWISEIENNNYIMKTMKFKVDIAVQGEEILGNSNF